MIAALACLGLLTSQKASSAPLVNGALNVDPSGWTLLTSAGSGGGAASAVTPMFLEAMPLNTGTGGALNAGAAESSAFCRARSTWPTGTP
jgi:hypothetical protein